MAPDPLKRSRQRQGPSLAFHTIGVQGYFSSVQPPLSEIPGSAPVFSLNNKNVNALMARELSGFTCTRSQTMNSEYSIPHEGKPHVVLKFLFDCQ